LEQVQRRGDWTRAGEITYAIIPDLERKLKEPTPLPATEC